MEEAEGPGQGEVQKQVCIVGADAPETECWDHPLGVQLRADPGAPGRPLVGGESPPRPRPVCSGRAREREFCEVRPPAQSVPRASEAGAESEV